MVSKLTRCIVNIIILTSRRHAEERLPPGSSRCHSDRIQLGETKLIVDYRKRTLDKTPKRVRPRAFVP